jgi:hypothetical protein
MLRSVDCVAVLLRDKFAHARKSRCNPKCEPKHEPVDGFYNFGCTLRLATIAIDTAVNRFLRCRTCGEYAWRALDNPARIRLSRRLKQSPRPNLRSAASWVVSPRAARYALEPIAMWFLFVPLAKVISWQGL